MQEEFADFSVKYALKKGAEYAEARLEHSKSMGFALKNGVPQISGFEKSQGVGIRFIVDGAMQFISTDELVKGKIAELIDMGIRNAKASKKLVSPIELADVRTEKKSYEVKEKVKASNVDSKDKLDVLLNVEKELMGSKLNVPSRFFVISDEQVEKYFVNSDGSRIKSKIPYVAFSFLITAMEKNETKQRHLSSVATGGWEKILEWDISEKVLHEAKVLIENIKFGRAPPKGEVDLVAAPEIVGIAMHESVGHPYEADRILGREAAQAGESFLTPDMIGMKIGKESINVVDDPVLEGSGGFYLYDDEGVKARRKFLIREGKINELLHNRETAASLKKESNASARAMDFAYEPIVRMSNTFMLPGEFSEEELIEDVKLGVYMKSFMEWNIDDKRVNERYVGNEAYLIENGKVKWPIKKPVIETTTLNFFASIDSTSKKVEFYSGSCGKGEPMQGIPVWMGGPSIRLKGIRLGTA
jgi:TldD protein